VQQVRLVKDLANLLLLNILLLAAEAVVVVLSIKMLLEVGVVQAQL
jgi:hypothetical protein